MQQQDQFGDALVSIHGEVAILGAMILNPVAVSDAIPRLRTEDFYLDSHKRIFSAISSMVQAGRPVEYVGVCETLMGRGDLSAVGGRGYVASLSEGVPRNFSVENYIRIVKNKASQRLLLAVGQDLATDAVGYDLNPEEILQTVRFKLDRIADDSSDDPIEPIGSYLDRTQPDPNIIFEHTAKSLGLSTPWNGLNELTCGLQPRDLIIIAGRPSMGKTAMAVNLAEHATRWKRKRVGFFSLEMSTDALLARLYCTIARVEIQLFRKGSLSRTERAVILQARKELSEAPLYLTDKSGLTASRIRSQATRLKRTEGLDLVIVDQLSGVSRADCQERDMRAKIGEQSRAFKRMAQELDVPVVLLNQLTRASTERKDARPMLSDLKESGNLEEDADLVLFVHRPEYYDRADPTLAGKGEIIVAKQRNGPTGTVHVNYNDALCLWRDETQEQMGY